jgi:hypothetical protein
VCAVAIIVQANASGASKAIVVDSASDLPELAQRPSEAMYLQHAGAGQAILYLEQDQGRKLAILDATDPANIRAVGQASINAPSPYTFVQDMDDSAILIQYRNRMGFAVINFKNYKQPALKNEPDYLHRLTRRVTGRTVSSWSPQTIPPRQPEIRNTKSSVFLPETACHYSGSNPAGRPRTNWHDFSFD